MRPGPRARSPATTELMLRNMFIGRPEGNYDRILDVSEAITGGLFFVPSAPLLESLAGVADTEETGSLAHSGSLNIGSLRGASGDE
jgi:porphyrinogen peroxidase